MIRILVLFYFCSSGTLGLDLEIINQWNFLKFDFPYDYELLTSFRPENTVFTGLEITDDRYFLAMPRLRAGVPATLACISRNSAPRSSPVLNAYPDWSFHTVGRGNSSGSSPDCNGLISVYRVRRDSCNRLWVLDSGIMTSLDDFTRLCPPKLVVFDLRTDQVVRTIVFPRQVLRPQSLLANLIVDESVQGSCDNAFIYMTDTASPGMVIYDGVRDTAWRVIHPTMFPDPDFSDHTVAGETFTLMDGIVGLAHSPKLGTVFYQPLATDRIFSVPTSALTKGPPAEFEVLPVSLVGRKSSTGLGLAMNLIDDSLLFSPLTETSVASYNPISGQQRLLAYDPELMQFLAEIRWSNEDGNIYALSTRFQKFFKRNVSPNEVNLRILRLRSSTRLSTGVSNNIFYKK